MRKDLSRILSFSEIQATCALMKEMGDKSESVIQITRLPEKYGIGKTVFVMAIRLMDATGVIDTISLGSKGTMVKIIEKEAINELIADYSYGGCNKK